MSQFLSGATRILASPGDSTTIVQRLARAAVPSVADFCLVFLANGDNVRCVATAHVTRAGERLLRGLVRIYRITRKDPVSTVAQVVRSGRTQLRTEIMTERDAPFERLRVFDLHQRLAARSALVVPVLSGDRVLGAISLGQSDSGRRFTAANVPLAERLAAHVARAIESGRPQPLSLRQVPLGRRTKPVLHRRVRARV